MRAIGKGINRICLVVALSCFWTLHDGLVAKCGLDCLSSPHLLYWCLASTTHLSFSWFIALFAFQVFSEHLKSFHICEFVSYSMGHLYIFQYHLEFLSNLFHVWIFWVGNLLFNRFIFLFILTRLFLWDNILFEVINIIINIIFTGCLFKLFPT